jgi:hypothetical protein
VGPGAAGASQLREGCKRQATLLQFGRPPLLATRAGLDSIDPMVKTRNLKAAGISLVAARSSFMDSALPLRIGPKAGW